MSKQKEREEELKCRLIDMALERKDKGFFVKLNKKIYLRVVDSVKFEKNIVTMCESC